MNNKNIVPIVFSFDNNFFIPAVVTFYSMIKHAHENTFYDIFIMMDTEKFRQENMDDLLRFEKRYADKCRINFIEMKGFGEDFAIQEERFNFSVYYRLFIHKYVNYDKVIFSDVDIVIVKDLYEVYSLDINDHYLGAIKQSLVNTMTDRKFKKYINKASGIKKGNYFNAGFLLLNLKKIKEGNYTDEFIRLSKMGFKNNDQDILNLVFENKVRYIPFKYCYAPVESYYKKIDKSKLREMYSSKDLEEYENDPAIIHYVGTKPWNINTLDIKGLELDRYKLWWDVCNECLTFVNHQAIFDLYRKLNNAIIQIGIEYNESQTVLKALKRLIAILAQRLGIYQLLKSLGYVS
jgi:UDP-glucose:(galactosyl)LPS alpha-1,2-glucosyltransferase